MAYEVLSGLLSPRHGPVPVTCALVMMRLLPTLLSITPVAVSRAAAGGAAGKKAGAQDAAGRRGAALQHILAMYRCGLHVLAACQAPATAAFMK